MLRCSSFRPLKVSDFKPTGDSGAWINYNRKFAPRRDEILSEKFQRNFREISERPKDFCLAVRQ
jgi:hypothetical protein